MLIFKNVGITDIERIVTFKKNIFLNYNNTVQTFK